MITLTAGLGCASSHPPGIEGDGGPLIEAYFNLLAKPDGSLRIDSNSRYVRQVLEGTPYSEADWYAALIHNDTFRQKYIQVQSNYLNSAKLLEPWPTFRIPGS